MIWYGRYGRVFISKITRNINSQTRLEDNDLNHTPLKTMAGELIRYSLLISGRTNFTLASGDKASTEYVTPASVEMGMTATF